MQLAVRLGHARLEISLAHGDMTPAPGESSVGRQRGGRETLLRWLETQLGLQRLPQPHAVRVAAYARMLAKASGASYGQSFQTDAWSTAKTLLALRDKLLLCGWDGAAQAKLPPLVKDLAKVESHNDGLGPCEAERLKAVLDALASGQKLPEHELQLREKPDQWPKAWQPVLAKLTICKSTEPAPHAAAKTGTVLHAFQAQILGKQSRIETVDRSLTWLRALSVFTAADAVAASLASLGREAAEIVILCEHLDAAVLLDDALIRRGVPPMGASDSTKAHPVLQVLPLWLSMSWEPLDPSQLLDFLNLPVSPIPGFASRMLAEAVSQQPGIGGRAWNEALARIAEAKADGQAKAQERVRALRDGGLVVRANGMPQKLLAQRCAYIAQWAGGYAGLLDQKDGQEELSAALKTLSGQASALPLLAEAFPGVITEPQLQRLLASVQEGGVCLKRRPPALGGPRWITSLSELGGPCGRLIWFGLHTGDLPSSPWTAQQAASLLAAGIDVDFDRRAHLLRRKAEREGMLKVSGDLLAVELASADERLHPVWLHGAGALGRRRPEILEDIRAGGGKSASWPLPTVKKPIDSELRFIENRWQIPPRYLHDRTSTSAGDLETRLGCPLKWVLEYNAKLRSSAVARLPPDFLLRGSLSHDILEEVFGKKPASPEDAAKRAAAAFDARLSTEAATLAQPGAMQARLEFRGALTRAARAFYELLERGGYEVVGFEFTPKTKLFGKEFMGRLDCLLKDGKGRQAVIDLKYAGGKKYREMLKEGKAIQLCVYAAAAAKPGAAPLAAGYFIIDRAQLFTPKASPVPGAEGAELVDGPSIPETWEKFEAAIHAADGWLKSGKVPARPLQPPQDRPAGAELALREIKDKRFTSADYGVCQYCEYGTLCGAGAVI